MKKNALALEEVLPLLGFTPSFKGPLSITNLGTAIKATLKNENLLRRVPKVYLRGNLFIMFALTRFLQTYTNTKVP